MARLQRFYKRPESPTDVRTDNEIVLFASDVGRLKVVNFDHEEHTLAYLDEISGGPGGGLQFGTYPQEGNWLYIETTSYRESYGIELKANAPIGLEGSGITLLAHDSSIHFQAPDFQFQGDLSGTDDFAVNVGAAIQISGEIGQISMASGLFQLFSNNSPLRLYAGGGADIELWASSGSVLIKSLHPGSPSTAVPIFQIIAGNASNLPEFHMLTGTSWVANL